MKDLNRWEGLERLAQDPRLRYTPTGKAVVNFTVATNRQWTTQEGERQEQSEFTPCVAWDKLAELITQYLLKGARVWVEGSLHTRKWEDRDGQTRYTTECLVSNLIMLDGRRLGERPSVEPDAVDGSFEEVDELPPQPGRHHGEPVPLPRQRRQPGSRHRSRHSPSDRCQRNGGTDGKGYSQQWSRT